MAAWLRNATLAIALLGACDRDSSERPSPFPRAEAKLEFVDESFEDLYPLFLLRKLKPGPKSALWNNYYGRWVRWTGTLVSFTANGLTFKQLKQTVTFDVSLWIDPPLRGELKKRLRKGDIVTYIGKLDSYDDVWRTLYLTHGTIVELVMRPDLGAPPDAAP